MSNAGSFKKGEKKPNQGKRGPSKTTLKTRETIAKFVEMNVDQMQHWLEDVAQDPKHGPAVAFKMLTDIMEYHIPKLSRAEHVGDGGGPVVLQISNTDELL